MASFTSQILHVDGCFLNWSCHIKWKTGHVVFIIGQDDCRKKKAWRHDGIIPISSRRARVGAPRRHIFSRTVYNIYTQRPQDSKLLGGQAEKYKKRERKTLSLNVTARSNGVLYRSVLHPGCVGFVASDSFTKSFVYRRLFELDREECLDITFWFQNRDRSRLMTTLDMLNSSDIFSVRNFRFQS